MDAILRRRTFDRRLFAAAAILFPLTVLVGFAPTYYLKGLFGGPPLQSWLLHAHGLLMSAWVTLFVTQVWFISSKRVRLHRRLGYAGIGLGLLILPVGLITALRAAKYSSTFAPPGISPLAFIVVPAFDLLMFAGLFGAAIYYRRQPSTHKRLMLLTAINFLPPAIARISIPALTATGPLWFFGFPAVLALLCVVWDAWHNGRLNRVFLVGTAALIASYVVRLAIMGTEGWMQVAQWLVEFV